jgi:hypothetical protein
MERILKNNISLVSPSNKNQGKFSLLSFQTIILDVLQVILHLRPFRSKRRFIYNFEDSLEKYHKADSRAMAVPSSWPSINIIPFLESSLALRYLYHALPQ